MKIIGLLTLFVITLTSLVWAQPADYERKCTAIVRGQTSEFSFPLPKRQTWNWNMKETNDNSQEYTWEISLSGTDSKSMYNFGVYLFKYPNSQEVTGSVDKLISAGQTSVWDQSSSLREDLTVQSIVKDQKLILKVSDKKTFSELFSQKPTIAHCLVRTPYEDLNFVGESQIEFKK